jgi:hypothetical protein
MGCGSERCGVHLAPCGRLTMRWNGRGELVCPLRGQSLESRLAAQRSVVRAPERTARANMPTRLETERAQSRPPLLGKRPRAVLGLFVLAGLALGFRYGSEVTFILLVLPCGFLAVLWLDGRTSNRAERVRRLTGSVVGGGSLWDSEPSSVHASTHGGSHDSGCQGGEHGGGCDSDH